MSWAIEQDNQNDMKMSNENQWKIGLTKVETSLRNIKKLHDDLKAKFDYIERSQINMKEIELKRQNINPLINEMSDYIGQLEKMIPSVQNAASVAMRYQLKDVKTRAANLTLSFKQLCIAINKELDNRQLTRKKELSVISNELGPDASNETYENPYQISLTEDPEYLKAVEEQKQSDQIAKDMLTLENIFVNFSTMINEQGETVNRIEANTEAAAKNIEDGQKELVNAVEYKKSAFKKKICIIGIVLAVLVVIALIIGLSVGLKKS